jgi:hypothetical protein
LNIIAGGGGNGTSFNKFGSNGSINGGSGAGLSIDGQSWALPGSANTSNNNFANRGGRSPDGRDSSSSGGGGSGLKGENTGTNDSSGRSNGGDGVQCNLSGINTFGLYGSYYWAASGGGGAFKDFQTS